MFSGKFTLDKRLKRHEENYLLLFCETQHVTRDVSAITRYDNDLYQKLGLGLGIDGEFYVGTDPISIVWRNDWPRTQPHLWCHWTPHKGDSIIWNGRPHFYYAADWIIYIIRNFLQHWGYVLNGKVLFRNEYIIQGGITPGVGAIVIEDNEVKTVDYSSMV